MDNTLTRDEMLAALQKAIDDNPTPEPDRTGELLDYFKLAHEEGLEPLTCKQIAQTLGLKRKHTNTLLRDLCESELIRYERATTQAYLYYYVSCNGSNA